MATVNFLFRSVKSEAPLNIRLLFSHDGEKYVISGKTQKTFSKQYWENDHRKQRINDIERYNVQKDVHHHLHELETFILKAFNDEDPTIINKEWLTKTIDHYYNPPTEQPQAPERLTDFFLFYADIRKNDLSRTRQQRLTVVRNKLLRYEADTNKKVFIPKVDDVFKKSFIDYGKNQGYAHNTLSSDLTIIKTVCTYAQQWNIQTSPQLENLRVSEKEVKNPYLDFDELERIRNHPFPDGGYLDNARDWLIISCYTGQRVSDFLKFTPKMVTRRKGKYFLQFTQTKTKKRIVIPFLDEAKAIFDKHGGKFPRPISSQKYNEYIKEVCKEAGINELTEGSVLTCIADDPSKATRNDYRREVQEVPKYKLVSSHIGRRSFATNYYGKVPTNYLIKITGHSTERMFLNYIQKTEEDTAFDAFKYF